MKLSELRACDGCGGPLAKPPTACWYVLRVSQAMVNPKAANQVLGLHQIFQGKAFGLAEVMAPDADDAVWILGDKEKGLLDELFVCLDCTMEHPLQVLLERFNARREKVKE